MRLACLPGRPAFGGAADARRPAAMAATGVVESDWTWAAVRARLYTRTSSIWPANHSLHTAFPPMRNGEPLMPMLPAARALATWVPFTYSRRVVPSQVVARCARW